jgi:hypothetical protein
MPTVSHGLEGSNMKVQTRPEKKEERIEKRRVQSFRVGRERNIGIEKQQKEGKSPEGWNHYIPFPSSFASQFLRPPASPHSSVPSHPILDPLRSPDRVLSFKPSQAVDTHVPDPLHEDPMRTLGKPPPRALDQVGPKRKARAREP